MPVGLYIFYAGPSGDYLLKLTPPYISLVHGSVTIVAQANSFTYVQSQFFYKIVWKVI